MSRRFNYFLYQVTPAFGVMSNQHTMVPDHSPALDDYTIGVHIISGSNN